MTTLRTPYGEPIELTEAQMDEEFSKIPQDLITEYFDLKDEKKRIEDEAEKEIESIRNIKSGKLAGNLISIDANCRKILLHARLDVMDIHSRLRKGGHKS